MSKEVLLAAFKKAEKEISSSKKTHKSKQISDELWNKFKFQISERSLRDYYNNYYESDTFNEEKELKPKVTEALCQYLGFDNYEDFILINRGKISDLPPEIEEGGNGNWIRKIIITVSLTLLVLTIAYLGYNWLQKECMTWSEDHYKRVVCNSNTININYNQEWVDNFKKVKNDTIQVFFGVGGEQDPLYWYYRKNNTIELFTKSGMHPTEKVQLKPITERIVRKYILKE